MSPEPAEITIDQARKLIASVKTTYLVKAKGQEPKEVVSVVGLRDRAILSTLAYTACRAGAIAKLRLQDFQHDGEQYVLRFQEKGGTSREIPVRLELQRDILAYVEAAGIGADAKDRPLFRSTVRKTKQLTGNALSSKAIGELVKRRLKAAKLPERLSRTQFSRDGDHRSAHAGRSARGCPVPRRAQQPANDAGFTTGGRKRSRGTSWSGFRFERQKD